MKKLLLCLFISLLFFSCTSDSEVVSIANSKKTPVKSYSATAMNARNPLDSIGKKYYDALMLYNKTNEFPTSINGISRQIKFVFNTAGKNTLSSRSIILFIDESVEAIMTDPDNSMITIVQNSSLGSAAKADLIGFLENLILQRDQEFNVLYNYIVSYESSTCASTTLTQEEKDTLLTVSSISRYSLYSESERKDRDWETSTGSRKTEPFLELNEISIISTIAFLSEVLY